MIEERKYSWSTANNAHWVKGHLKVAGSFSLKHVEILKKATVKNTNVRQFSKYQVSEQLSSSRKKETLSLFILQTALGCSRIH